MNQSILYIMADLNTSIRSTKSIRAPRDNNAKLADALNNTTLALDQSGISVINGLRQSMGNDNDEQQNQVPDKILQQISEQEPQKVQTEKILPEKKEEPKKQVTAPKKQTFKSEGLKRSIQSRSLAKDKQMEDPGPTKYVFGQFSKYAVQKQKQIGEREEAIDSVIKQAMLSHLQKIRFYSQQSRALEQTSKKLQSNIQNLIGKEQNVYRMIKQPAKEWTKIYIDNQQDYEVKQMFSKFIRIMFAIKNLRIVDGKIIDENNWKQSSMRTENNNNILLQSKDNAKVYIELGQNKIGTNLFEWGGTLHTKDQLLKFDSNQRKIILTMVISFLKQKKILVNEDQINISINKMLQKALSSY